MAWRSGRSCSADLRHRVLAAVDGDSTAKAVALRFGVSLSCICKALARRRETGETQARAQRSHQGPKLAEQHAAIHSRGGQPSGRDPGRAAGLARGRA